MERLNYIQADVEEQRDVLRNSPEYGAYSTPLPGTALKQNDDVLWVDVIPMRVLWGTDSPDIFAGYSPDMFGPDTYVFVEGQYVTDRAPADPQETPMPIYPQQAQQPQHKKHKHDPKAALKRVLDQLDHEHQKKLRALVRQTRPELLDESHK